MRTIIAGSRGLKFIHVVQAMKLWPFPVTEVVSGACKGIDLAGEKWANGRGIKVKQFPADWKNSASPTYRPNLGYDPAAGYRRNGEMADYAEALVAIHDGVSKGTLDMIGKARARGLEVFVYVPPMK